MPLYDFRCEGCRHTFEALCSRTSTDSVTCPSCGKASPSRLISKFAVNTGVSPCGSRADAQPAGCGYSPAMGGCGHCGIN